MEVECPSQGSDKGDADPPKPGANMGTKITGGFRHHLPQIPVMNVGHKIAQSKASAKQDNRATVQTSQQPETTQLHIEGTGKIVEISGTGRQEEIFTPPETESSSNSSPGDAKPVKNGSAKDRLTGTPIKLRIRRANRDGELDLSSCVDEAPQNIDPSFNESRSADSLASAENPEEAKNTSPKTPSTEKRGRKKKISRGSQGAKPTSTLPKSPKVEEGTPKWLVGDLVWSKVSGHPWWPCMVSYDPYEGVYTKLRSGKYRVYHVQFFGNERERGWVSETATMPFEGKQQLEDYFKSMALKATPKQRAQYKLDFGGKRRISWDIAWQCAEEAIPLSKAERKQKYTYTYNLGAAAKGGSKTSPVSRNNSEEDTGTGRTKTKAKLKKALITARTSRLHGQGTGGPATPSSEDGVNGESTSKRGRKRKQTHYAENESEEEEEPSPRRKRKKRQSSPEDLESSGKKSYRTVKSDGSFEVFCDKHRESVLWDNPDFDDKTLSEYLQQQWDMMDSKQKFRYRSKFGNKSSKVDDVNEEAQKDVSSVKKSGRVSKPSMKKVLAEEEKSGVGKPSMKKVQADEDKSDVGKPSMKKEQADEEKSDVGKQSMKKVQADEEKSDVGKQSMKKVLAVEEKSSGSVIATRRLSRRSSDNSLASSQEETVQTASSSTADQLPSGDSTLSAPTQKKSECRVASTLDDDYMYADLEIAKLCAAGPSKKENVCQLCENIGELISCEGPCIGSFHANCLGINRAPEQAFKCDECTSGIHTCFSCKKSSADTKRCSIPQCGKFYHEACVKGYKLTRADPKGFICPLHTCATCAAENPKCVKNNKGRLFRCVRCPVAYHVGDFCIAAGSIPLAGYNIVCSHHFQPVKTQKHHAHVNVSWCFICNNGGTLLCCESCPAAFHETCLKIEKPEGNWYCRDCTLGKRPLYGDVIWIKLGNYRWWPGEICHPKNVPTNIQEKAHQVGEFPVKFLGSNEYFWIHQGRVFLFQEGDKGSRGYSNAKILAKMFAKAVKQGSKAFRMWKAVKENRAQQDIEKNDKKPAPYKLIKTNIPCGNVQLYKPDQSELPRCECEASQENPCGPDSECVNRMLMYECHQAVCPAGEKCQNQRFQKRQYPESVPFRTRSRGWGLKTVVDIKKGEFVNEYVGELVDEEECRRRIQKAHDDNISNFYMLTIDKNRIIDAGPKGNYSRFMNHSCQPNLETQKWTINGEVRVGLFAAQDIPAESELTFNYNLDCLGNEKTVCGCGAPICSGFLGVQPKTSAAAANEKRAKEMKKRKKKKHRVDVKKEHDDDCFRCGEGGELVMCDKAACPKVYHLQCLNLAKPPHGKWVCPWHHCDECGKSSSLLCSRCPNSFCTSHSEDRMFATEENKLVCLEHEHFLSSVKVTKVDPKEVKEPVDTDKGSTNEESGVTDSDSLISSEESEKLTIKLEPEVTPMPKVTSSRRKSLPATPSSETKEKISRTGRKIKKRNLDSPDINGIEEAKPKSVKMGKKQTPKSKAQLENVNSSSNSVASVNMSKEKSTSSKVHPIVEAVKDTPMFDDSDDEGLVIDIPAI